MIHTNETLSRLARDAFHASKDAGNDDGAALADAGEAIGAAIRETGRTGTFDQETLTWTFDEVGT